MTSGHPGAITRRCLGLAAGAAALFYVGWNAYWIGRGALPPSILRHLTGIPVPTTGFLRSQIALAEGRVGDSLAWNALGAPIVVLLVVTGALLLRRAITGSRLVIPAGLARVWFVVLGAAWIVKLVQGPRWW